MKTGLDVLAADGFTKLKGKKIGLVTHPAAALADGTPAIEALRAGGVKVAALFGPEHGVRGDVPAGKWVESYKDSKTGLPVYSLYGKTKVPTAAMLQGLDVLVFALQDIGCRSYTYLSTLGCVLEGAARVNLPVLVLDRPNPLGLTRVEGGPVQPGFTSFVSKYPVAYRHGMTLGELAKMLISKGWLSEGLKPRLEVVACVGLKRTDPGWDTRRWIPTSPNIPTLRAAQLYAATGIIGELDCIAIGVGTDDPFGYFGSPTLDSAKLLTALKRVPVAGFTYEAATFTPSRGLFSGQMCQGVRVKAPPGPEAQWTRPNFALLAALRTTGVTKPFSTGEPSQMFDYSCGSSAVRRSFDRGAGAEVLWTIFQSGAAQFEKERAPFLLYS
ncbi:exo-beta-N-acetylmuramidase NamZ domain-containing protein [Armatimonas sp.]|uniref:exo-beta-N-acetylmuramidase NamZ family protein n=1 Tax=Armatimonas sp. TaxID=1872638 RepID=UPI003752D407